MAGTEAETIEESLALRGLLSRFFFFKRNQHLLFVGDSTHTVGLAPHISQ